MLQRKVTVFVTRGAGTLLCVFWHAGAGIQLPAGTVEDGESYEAAARREAFEETGLAGLELVGRLGTRRRTADPGTGWVLRPAAVRTRPNGPATSWLLGRTEVRVIGRRDGHARVVYEESDLDARTEPLVYARLEGRIPDGELTDVQERAFFHFRAADDSPAQWRVRAEPEHVFDLHWVPLDPKPEMLIGPNQEWLDEFHHELH